VGFLLDDSELRLFDIIVTDNVAAGGDDINYYSVNKAASIVDPLYGEYIKRQVDGPWLIPANVKWPERRPIAGETGFTVEFDGLAVVARSHLDQNNAPYPYENDILEMWRTPYHDADSLGKGMFFDIIAIKTDGHLNDTATFTKFILTLKRRPEFGAERRLP
jgi:hypothetical protein